MLNNDLIYSRITCYLHILKTDHQLNLVTYYAPFCLYAKRFVDDEEICKNIVSDVFTNLWQKKDEVDFEGETIIGLIKTSVKNACFNHLKHLKHEWKYEQHELSREPIYSSSPESTYTLNELYELLYKKLDQLPEEYKTVFVLSYIEGKSQTEIAKMMNVSNRTIHRYKTKTLEQLKKELKDYLPLLLVLLVKL